MNNEPIFKTIYPGFKKNISPWLFHSIAMILQAVSNIRNGSTQKEKNANFHFIFYVKSNFTSIL